jgi:putative ABC transport system ATP-binding protein
VPPILSLRNVAKTYEGPRTRRVLEGLSLDLAPGEYVAIMGESGIGKSTLLNLVAGLDRPDSGTITFDGDELTALDDDQLTLIRRDKMGFVFQAFHVLPHLTLEQNVGLPLVLKGVPGALVAHAARRGLQEVGLGGREQSWPRELSGGELQRVAIARALVGEPRMLLADEPTGNLDPDTAALVLGLLRSRIRARHAAGILVTHSRAAARTADRVLMLGRDGLRPVEVATEALK